MEEIIKISIHALREEGDRSLTRSFPLSGYFYPRPPRGGRPLRHLSRTSSQPISIHALREEGDAEGQLLEKQITNFYPRPPRGGRRSPTVFGWGVFLFLSTPSARRATSAVPVWTPIQQISIHALREEGDVLRTAMFRPVAYFYPRPPRGGRPEDNGTSGDFELISIHALREEGDQAGVYQHREENQISIHALREEGDDGTVPAGRCRTISIHALREEGDMVKMTGKDNHNDFYPRPPRGGRHCPQHRC